MFWKKKFMDRYGELMPRTEEIFGYIEDLTGMGMRQSGAPGGLKAQDYLLRKFRSFGLQDVRVLPTRTDIWTCDDWRLEVEGETIDSYRMYMSFFDCKYDAEGRLKTDEDGTPGKEHGVYGTFSTADPGQVTDAPLLYAEDLEALEAMDPETIRGKAVACNVQVIYTSEESMFSRPEEFIYAQKCGAACFIGILKWYFDSNRVNPEDYTYMLGSFRIPGFYVTRKAGDELQRLMKEAVDAGRVPKAHFEMTVKVTRTDKAGPVVGLLPGRAGGDGRKLMISSHYDATTPQGATQDASGTSMVLTLARLYGQLPRRKRARDLLFVLHDTHSSDYDAHDTVCQEFLGGRWDEGTNAYVPDPDRTDVLIDLSVEHISEEARIVDGQLIMTGNVNDHFLFTPDTPAILKIVEEEAALFHDRKTTGLANIMPVGRGDFTIADSTGFWDEGRGLPVISLISSQCYLYDDCDTLEKVPQRALRPTAEFLAELIWRMMPLRASAFRLPEEASGPGSHTASGKGLSKDSRICELMSDPEAAAICEKYIPGASSNEDLEYVKNMKLKTVQPLSRGLITKEALAAIDEELRKL